MNLREEFPEITEFVDKLREYFTVEQPIFLEGTSKSGIRVKKGNPVGENNGRSSHVKATL